MTTFRTKVPGQLRTWYWNVTLSEIDVRMCQFSAWNFTVLRLSQRWSWSFQSSGMRNRVLGREVTNVSKGSFYLHLLGWVCNPPTEGFQLPISTPLTSKAFKCFILTQLIKVYVRIHRKTAVKFKNDSSSPKCSRTWMLISTARLISQTERLQYLHSSAIHYHPWHNSYCLFTKGITKPSARGKYVPNPRKCLWLHHLQMPFHLPIWTALVKVKATPSQAWTGP